MRSGWLIALTAALVAFSACGGGSTGHVPGVAAVEAERDTGDGAALSSSTVTVHFDSNYRLANGDIPLASFFELEVPDGLDAQKTTRVLVARAGQLPTDQRALVLHVDRVVPDGSVLHVARKLFDKSGRGELTGDVSGDLSPLAALLATTELEIGDPDIVDSLGDPPVRPADRDPAAMRDELRAHLSRRQAPDALVEAAIKRYDTIPPELVPSPRLRAALAALTGTFAEPAIDYLLTDANCTGRPIAALLIQVPPEMPSLFARVTFAADGRRVISVNPAIEGERLERLMSILAHESVHCDNRASRTEEIAATAFDTLLYITLLATNPDMSRDGTRLTKELNLDAVAMINSGRAFPESAGVLQSVAVRQAIPGTTATFRSFAELVAHAYEGIDDRSPDEPLAQAYAAVLARSAGVPPGSAFNLSYLDGLIGGVLPTRVLLFALEALSLVPAK